MKNRLFEFRDTIRSSYWFIPAIMAVLAVALSIATIRLDEGIGRELRWVTGLIYVDSPEGARAVLSTVASSMITVAGVVFSLTMVVLSLTSQQYGPLILVHFMRDQGNQFVLGIFTATFIYCLLVLRTIRGVETSAFVPHISVLVGLGLAIASLALLIYFIHHVSRSIQGPDIIARLRDNLMETIDDVFPQSPDTEATKTDGFGRQLMLARFDQEAHAVLSPMSGYLQMVDEPMLLKIAQGHDTVIRLEVSPGQFLMKGQPLARVLASEALTSQMGNSIQSACVIGRQRTPTQDVEFIVVQLSALSVRALSPAINDPYTATMVIDRLGEGLIAVLERHPRPQHYHDEAQHLRVIIPTVGFVTLFRSAFDQIKHYGQGDPKVAAHLMYVFKALWDRTQVPAYRLVIRRYIIDLYKESQDVLTNSEDERLQQIYAEIEHDIFAFQDQDT